MISLAVYSRSARRSRHLARLLAASALSAAVAAPFLPVLAQSTDPLLTQDVGVEQKMLLEADQLVYDFDRQTVTAIGNVQIYYGAYVLDAERVTYDQKAGRLVATGGVRMLEPDGTLITAERLDITDDFRDGFVESLNVITTERGRFSAQSAERRDGNLIIFRQGVYTACAPCLENPDKPPLWQIKAARIIHDREERTVYYEHARLEFVGVPIAYLPVFFHPDPTVTRKSGFLVPSILQREAIGFGVTTPVFWNLAPNYDVTFSPTFLTRQGVLMQAEWRHRLLNGAYSIRLAGIFQQDKDAFVDDDGDPLSGHRDFRGGVHTAGNFALSDLWQFGWDIHATTDRTFNRDYRIPDATAQDLTSTLYLTGFSDRNYFDLRGYHFRVQRENTEEEIPDGPDPDALPDLYVHNDQAEQAVVHPVLDHNYIVDRPVLGGELRFDSNIASISRDQSDIRHPPPGDFFAGVAGSFTRATSRAMWSRKLLVPGGQLITPFSYLQADASFVAADDPAAGLGSDDAIGRAMPAVGVEYEWPFLAVLGPTVHTFGPRAQIIARPDESADAILANEDSQSLVFDDSSLFELDKFAGYDRQEGGTRANVGLTYQGLFPSGAAVDALFGQSFQLAGENSFAIRDHALTGLGSGLEDEVSDYVSRVTVNTGAGVALSARGRFDNSDLALNRGELNAIGAYGDSVASLGYAFIRESAAAGIFENREEMNAAASVEFVDNWSVLGSIVYDIRNASTVSHSFGLAYADECFEISAVYSETPQPYSDLVADRQIYLRVNLKTIGSSQVTSQLDGQAEED